MSVRVNASGDDLRRTANLPASNAITICGWARVIADGGGGFQCLGALRNAAGAYIGIWWDYNNNTMTLDANGTTTGFGSRPAAGVDFFWALTNSGTGAGSMVGYWARASDTAFTTASRAGATVATPTSLQFSNFQNSDWLDSRHGRIRCFDAVLTSAELWAEMWSMYPRRQANINFAWRLNEVNDTADFSGNGRGATVSGTLGTEDDFPLPHFALRAADVPYAAAAATGDMTAAGSLSITGAADLDATGTLTAAGALSITGVADLDAIGQLVAEGLLTITGSAIGETAGVLTAAGAVSITGSADLDSFGALIAAGNIVITGAADLTSPTNNDIAAQGSVEITGFADLDSIGSLLAAGSVVINGAADLTDGVVAANVSEWIIRARRRQRR